MTGARSLWLTWWPTLDLPCKTAWIISHAVRRRHNPSTNGIAKSLHNGQHSSLGCWALDTAFCTGLGWMLPQMPSCKVQFCVSERRLSLPSYSCTTQPPLLKYRFRTAWCCSAASLQASASRSSGAPSRACWCGCARSPHAVTGSRSSRTWLCRQSTGWPSSAHHRHQSSSSGCSTACGQEGGRESKHYISQR